MKARIAILGLACAFARFAGPDCTAASFDLQEILRYPPSQTSALLTATGLEWSFFGGGRGGVFHSRYRQGTAQRRTNFRASAWQLDRNGLAMTSDTFYDPAIHASSFSPAWKIAPAVVEEGQVIESSAAFSGVGAPSAWSGTTRGTLTVGRFETQPTLAGKVPVVPMTLRHEWSETGAGSRGNGVITQTWWMTREAGVVKVDYAYAETNLLGVVSSGAERFHLASSTLLQSPQTIHFPDANLEAAVRAWLGKPSGDLTSADLARLTSLDAAARGIANLAGLDFAYRLGDLRLASNQVADLYPLAKLTELRVLDLAHNQARNLLPLSNLTALTVLTLTRNGLSDLSPLRGLASLRLLAADENQISDVSPLAALGALESAILGANQIRDVRPLAGLTRLQLLEIEANQVSDITSLGNLTLLRNASVEENCLDVSAGADDRGVIDGWMRNGTEVEPEYVMQRADCGPAPINLRIARDDTGWSLSWDSAEGDFYRVEASSSLPAWTDAHPAPIPGTGSAIHWPIPSATDARRYFRIRHAP